MKTRMIIRREKGVAALELAIVLPVLILLAIGICEFGIIYYDKQVLTNASREGARAGIVRSDVHGDPYDDADEIEQRARDRAEEYYTGRLISFGEDDEPDIVVTGYDLQFPDNLSVEIEYEYFFLVPSLFDLGLTRTLTAYTEMKIETQIAAGS
jgi:hypothetical protein